MKETIKLNDYLYDGDTVLKILFRYAEDLRAHSIETNNQIDRIHSNFLMQVAELLMHNDFLTSQSQRIQEFYDHMAEKYPTLAFTFKGRIKSLIRTEEKFNGNIVSFIYDYYKEHGNYPALDALKNKLNLFRDLLAYRIVISLPKCHQEGIEEPEKEELRILYEIANELPEFLEQRGFTAEYVGNDWNGRSARLNANASVFYKDYIENPNIYGYQSLHITFYDNVSRSFLEVQLRTKRMDDIAEIGTADHRGYEKRQEHERSRRDEIPEGESIIFDEAHERLMALQNLELKDLDVNMFYAANNSLINDGCGLFRGRLILPFEHLSRFQDKYSW